MIIPLKKSSTTGKTETAVLSPNQSLLIREKLNPIYKMRWDVFLYTAMRIREAKYFAEHPEYLRKENGAIFLPTVEGLGKKRCTIKSRAVMLSPNGIKAVEEFFDHKVGFAAYQNMEDAIVLAAEKADFETKAINTKMLRKTMISWLIMAYPEREAQISHFAGHDVGTMRGYYLTFGWRKEDVKDMRMFLEGWGEA
jgi:integrase